MLLPKKAKHRKWHKPGHAGKGVATRLVKVSFGSFGLTAMTEGWVTSRQIEAARRVLTRYVKKGGRIFIRIFPDRPVTKKGNELPMGGGKGAPDHYVCTIKPGTVMFEMEGIPEKDAHVALIAAGHKLPVKVRFVKKV